MDENKIDGFLRKVTEERELSEQEKKEAMTVAREVWKKAREKIGEKKDIILKKEDQLSGKYIHVYTAWDTNSPIGKKLREAGRENVDLIINVITESRDMEKGPMTQTGDESYYFSPDEVVKENKSIELPADKMLDYISSLDSLRSMSAMRRYQGVLNERRTTKASHPDSKELQGLLNLVSSAKIPSHSVKIVPRSK